MHNWKWVNLSKMAGFNISLSLNERQSSSNKKHNKSLRLVLFIPFRCCFAGSLPFSLSTVKQTKLFHSISEMFFTFLTRKNSLRKTFLLECVRSGAQQAARKGGNFGAKLTHLCGVWLDVSFFSHVKKLSIVCDSDWTYHFFFTCEKHSSLPWLARTHLCIKIYNTTFWWVFLTIYIIKVIAPGLYCSYPILNSCPLAFKHIQLFQERLLEKVHATFLKGIVVGFECTVLQRNLKEWHLRPQTHLFEC